MKRPTNQQIAAFLIWLIGALLIAHASPWYILVHGFTTFALLRWSFVLPNINKIDDRSFLNLLRIGGPPIGTRMLTVFDAVTIAAGLVVFAGADMTTADVVNGIAVLLAFVIGVLLAIGPYAVLEK